MSNLIPVGMSRDELADVLVDITARIRQGDSFEGNVQYMMPSYPEEFPDGKIPDGYPQKPCDFWVSGVYRVGNTMGQGGMRMIGTVPAASQDLDRWPP